MSSPPATSILAGAVIYVWQHIQLHPWWTALTIVFTQVIVTRYRDGLRQVPGPFVASFSNLWKLRAVWNKNMHRENVRVHEDYGPIVRIGPNHVSVADAQSMHAIYGVQNVFRKVINTQASFCRDLSYDQKGILINCPP